MRKKVSISFFVAEELYSNWESNTVNASVNLISTLKRSNQVNDAWYNEKYPDVAALGMDPAMHYLKYGAAMGRNPGKSFDTQFYLETYPNVARSEMNPLLHYTLHGQQKGHARNGARKDPRRAAWMQIEKIRGKLLGLGFTEQPLAELDQILQTNPDPVARTLAARELALWYMREKSEAGYRTALTYIAIARENAPDLDFQSMLSVAELICHRLLDQPEDGCAAYDRAALAGEATPDVMLAWVNFQQTPALRVVWINQVLKRYDIPPIALLEDDSLSPYDRLTSAEPLPAVTNGPKVTVLIAAYEAAEMLPTALRSLQEQTWQNLEIIVIDDCSPNPGTREVVERFSASDARIRLIRMEENGGAYVARNRGLDAATGEFVTIYDADDWSHPLKIETQVRFMEENPDVMGCTSQQARCQRSLTFTMRVESHSGLVSVNTSSFLWRRQPVREKLGYWDTVRFGADSEFIGRVQKVFGKSSVKYLHTGPLSFMRNEQLSITADPITGYNGTFFGARRQYAETQTAFHSSGASLKYDGMIERRPFPVPEIMYRSKAELARKPKRHFDVIIASEFRMVGGSTQSSGQEVACQKKFGLNTAIFPMSRYDFGGHIRPILKEVWDHVDGKGVSILAYGEEVSCDLLILRYPPILYHRQRYLPEVNAKHIKVIVNQPPMSDYTPEGVVRYKLADCAENIRHYFGKDATWHPIGPLVREALHTHHGDELQHINLSPEDWHNIIDIEGWDRGPRKRGPSDKLRIGRHSRDHFVKWLDTSKEIMAAYPASEDVDVHVLGGAKAPTALIGNVPPNWTVYPFGTRHPKDFLAEIDVFVYFSHPDWVESFGRTIIEAMAVGVPVILPEVYRPLFKDAAIYATPQTAVETAQKLHADPVAYAAQVEKAHRYAAEQFSYEMHIQRVNSAIKYMKKPSKQDSLEVSAPISALPRRSGKTSADTLTDLPNLDLDAGEQFDTQNRALLRETVSDYRLDYLWAPKQGAERLFVLFSGDAMRKKNAPPVFQRWSWAPHFPGHCLYVSDPMLHLHPDLGLAWYAGTEDFDPILAIIRRIQMMLPMLGLSARDVCSYGSSGGGFAALRMAALLPEMAAISINAQTNIAEYERKSPDRYAQICLNRPDRHTALADYPMRMDLTRHVETLRMRRLILIQNSLDHHHFEKHYKPFCAAMGASADENLKNGLFRRVLFEHEGGHRAAESAETFTSAMAILAAGM